MALAAFQVDPASHFLRDLRRRIQRRKPLLPALLGGAVVGVAAVAGLTICRLVFFDNFHVVQPGRVFRCGQLTPERMRAVIAERRIKTVINLRGCCAGFPWYEAEARATHVMNVSQEDVCFSAIRLPAPAELRLFIHVLDRSEYPILLHCRQGVDRTGLAAVAVKLLEPDISLGEARGQLGLSFGYVPFNGTENMQEFFDLYEAWLDQAHLTHSPETFRHWACKEYCPGRCSAKLELVGFPSDRKLPTRSSQMLTLRVQNMSVRAWPMSAGSLQGVHARYDIRDTTGNSVFHERAGLFDRVVAPRQTVDLSIGIPALAPGEYTLQLDLIDIDQNAFSQFGFEPLLWTFRVD